MALLWDSLFLPTLTSFARKTQLRFKYSVEINGFASKTTIRSLCVGTGPGLAFRHGSCILTKTKDC